MQVEIKSIRREVTVGLWEPEGKGEHWRCMSSKLTSDYERERSSWMSVMKTDRDVV